MTMKKSENILVNHIIGNGEIKMNNKFLKITTIATVGALACYIAKKYNIRAELSIKGDIPEKLADLITKGTYR